MFIIIWKASTNAYFLCCCLTCLFAFDVMIVGNLRNVRYSFDLFIASAIFRYDICLLLKLDTWPANSWGSCYLRSIYISPWKGRDTIFATLILISSQSTLVQIYTPCNRLDSLENLIEYHDVCYLYCYVNSITWKKTLSLRCLARVDKRRKQGDPERQIFYLI